MFYELQNKEQREAYKEMLKIIGNLSLLFSDSPSPYLPYRCHENIFCKYFEAENIWRKDCSADAQKGIYGSTSQTIKAIEKALIHYGIINEDSVPVLELPVSHISVERTKQYNQKQETYKEIQSYILDKYEVKTHTSYIAEIKRLHGIEMLSNRRKSKPKNEVKHPTKEMVKMIEDALMHFDIIKQDQITE